MDKPPVNLFSGPISMLSRSLDLRARQHEMILNNVANADTPNFKPFKMNVEEALQDDLQPDLDSPLNRTDDRHFGGTQMAEDPSADITSGTDNPLLLRGDQNGVDIDAEMTALAKNSLLYRTSTQIVTSKFKGLKKAISGGSQ